MCTHTPVAHAGESRGACVPFAGMAKLDPGTNFVGTDLRDRVLTRASIISVRVCVHEVTVRAVTVCQQTCSAEVCTMRVRLAKRNSKADALWDAICCCVWLLPLPYTGRRWERCVPHSQRQASGVPHQYSHR